MYGNYNPYMQQRYQQPTVPQNDTQYVPQMSYTPQYIKSGIQGKQVDSVDVVKATDVPFDGSVSYFPLTDGTAIVTKQLQMDGTSKIVIYKPVDEDKTMKFLTLTDLEDIQTELSDIRKQLKELKKDD